MDNEEDAKNILLAYYNNFTARNDPTVKMDEFEINLFASLSWVIHPSWLGASWQQTNILKHVGAFLSFFKIIHSSRRAPRKTHNLSLENEQASRLHLHSQWPTKTDYDLFVAA